MPLSGVRTNDPTVRASEDSSCLRPRAHCDQRDTKFLRKSENHTNALAVNLLDSSETTHRLKRYTALTPPDRPE
jgi:hypothetical protein